MVGPSVAAFGKCTPPPRRSEGDAAKALLPEHEIRPNKSAPAAGLASACVEQFMPITDLRVVRILNLQSRRGPAVAAVRAVRPLGDDALEVPLARDAVEVTAALVEMIEV